MMVEERWRRWRWWLRWFLFFTSVSHPPALLSQALGLPPTEQVASSANIIGTPSAVAASPLIPRLEGLNHTNTSSIHDYDEPSNLNSTPIWLFEAIKSNSTEVLNVSASDKNNNSLEFLRRQKRKVISRGGHYIIRSSSGRSPWSSSTYESDNYNPYRTSRPRSYGYNPRGRIGDAGARTSTFGENTSSHRTARRSQRKKLSRSFKGEIAQYAILYGVQKAALHYEQRVGRRLRDRVVQKFIQRYRERVKKTKKKSRKQQ
ncbi:hypothetical protein SK128_023049 [Halocaridina rubra]|uniref:Uncharacterized protein n=1 Tax=Halocaridina rubra TaxID=373956 RepID=A0AAN8WUU1_HALRR